MSSEEKKNKKKGVWIMRKLGKNKGRENGENGR